MTRCEISNNCRVPTDESGYGHWHNILDMHLTGIPWYASHWYPTRVSLPYTFILLDFLKRLFHFHIFFDSVSSNKVTVLKDMPWDRVTSLVSLWQVDHLAFSQGAEHNTWPVSISLWDVPCPQGPPGHNGEPVGQIFVWQILAAPGKTAWQFHFEWGIIWCIVFSWFVSSGYQIVQL